MDDAAQRDFERHLQAAEGYIELGMYLDADAELEGIDSERRHETVVLILRLGIYRGLKRWDLMLAVAKALTVRDPESAVWIVALATAMRHSVSIDAARCVLLEAAERIPGSAGIHYNLACYECLLGDVEVAKVRLKHALQLDASLKAKAIDDEDLAAVWE